MLDKDIGDGSRTPAWRKDEKDEFDNLYIDAQKITAHDPVLASVLLHNRDKKGRARLIGWECHARLLPNLPIHGHLQETGDRDKRETRFYRYRGYKVQIL